MNDLKTAVMIVYGIAFLCLLALVAMMAMNIAVGAQETVSFLSVAFFVSATSFGVFRLVKGNIETQKLYSTIPMGFIAVSVFPVSVLVANWIWMDLIRLIQLVVF